MRTLFLAMTSAALSTSCQESRKKAMWCRPEVGPPTKAMSCGVVERAIQVAACILPSGPTRICSVRKKSMHSAMKRVLSSTVLIPASGFISHISRQWSIQCAPAPLRPSGQGSGFREPTSVPTHSFLAYRRISWPLGRSNCSMRPTVGWLPSGSMVVFTPQASMRACRLSRSASFCTL